MTPFTWEKEVFQTSIAITRNNDVVWFMSWTPPSLTSLIIFCIMSPIWTNVFFMGVDELQGWLWSFFFSTLGEVSSSVINPHLSTTHGFSDWFSSTFHHYTHVINVQIGRVCKHDNKTSMIRSIPCPTILNDILFNEICTCKKNNNLMFAQVSTQHPFTCATNILGEKKWDFVFHI